MNVMSGHHAPKINEGPKNADPVTVMDDPVTVMDDPVTVMNDPVTVMNDPVMMYVMDETNKTVPAKATDLLLAPNRTSDAMTKSQRAKKDAFVVTKMTILGGADCGGAGEADGHGGGDKQPPTLLSS